MRFNLGDKVVFTKDLPILGYSSLGNMVFTGTKGTIIGLTSKFDPTRLYEVKLDRYGFCVLVDDDRLSKETDMNDYTTVREDQKTPVYEAHMYLRRRLDVAEGEQLDRIGAFYNLPREEIRLACIKEEDRFYRGRLRSRIDSSIWEDKTL